MELSSINLEEMYSCLALEEEAGVVIREGEIGQRNEIFVLIGRFLTEKNINFEAMQNVLASLYGDQGKG